MVTPVTFGASLFCGEQVRKLFASVSLICIIKFWWGDSRSADSVKAHFQNCLSCTLFVENVQRTISVQTKTTIFGFVDNQVVLPEA